LKTKTDLRGDPLRPRPFPASHEKCLFSTASVSSRWRGPVETNGFILKREEAASYKIIYSEALTTRCRQQYYLAKARRFALLANAKGLPMDSVRHSIGPTTAILALMV
jgi:hypothetical protein